MTATDKKNGINTVGTKLDITKAVCREFDLNEIYKYVKTASKGGYPLSWSWGLNAARVMVDKKALRFRVSGNNHKGLVYIVLDGSDTFTLYYTDVRQNIKKVTNMVYIDSLVEILDNDIEYVPEYGDR